MGTFGAKPAFDAALNLEMMGPDGDFAGTGEAYAALEEEIDRLTPALAALREEATP